MRLSVVGSAPMLPTVLLLPLFVTGLTLRPYVPPVLEPEPAYQPPTAASVEIVPQNGEWDVAVLARPQDLAPMVGSIERGTRVPLRGELAVEHARYCPSNRYYALKPYGWLCTTFARPRAEPPAAGPVLTLSGDTPVPYRYVMVVVEEGSSLPMWSSVDALRAQEDPERQLERGDTIALAPEGDKDTPSRVTVDGVSYYISVDGKVLPQEGTYRMRKFSEWQGVSLPPDQHFPFGWVEPRKAPVYDAPDGKRIDELARRTRVDILGEQGEGRARWLQIGEGRYMKASHVNEVRKLARPEGTGELSQWIDVDLGEQTVVAYQGDRPVFATLTSSGRPPNRTPRGNYPVWGKASAITMKSQAYDDKAYYVNRVPWVLFFQAHNALHGAYWHDRFGHVKSHGCANLSPKDARTLFEWLEPKLPPGWTSVRYWDLTKAPVVHVRDSSRTKPFVQERNIGPPDPQDEQKRLDAAIARREAEAAELAAQTGAAISSSQAGAVPAVQPGQALSSAPAAAAPAVAAQPAPLAPAAQAAAQTATAAH